MKKNIFFVVLALFSVTLSLDAAKKNEGKNIELVCSSSSSSSSSSSALSSLSGDEKVEIVSGFSIYRDLEKNDLQEVQETIAAMLWDTAESKDYKLIMGVKDVVDGLDQKNVHALIDPVFFYQCVVKAVLSEEQDEFWDSLSGIKIERTGSDIFVNKCSNPQSIDYHTHTFFYYYQLRDGNLIFDKQQEAWYGVGIRN